MIMLAPLVFTACYFILAHFGLRAKSGLDDFMRRLSEASVAQLDVR